jgi:hypothetical protein
VPLAVVTSASASEFEARCLEAGANAFIEKSNSPAQIIAALRALLVTEEEENEEEEDDNEEDLIPIVPYKDKQVRHLHTFTNQDRKNIKRTGHKVQGKHLETGEIKIWESAALAAEEVTGNARKNSNIMTCARNCYKCYGYKWSVVEERHKKKPVFGIHKKTERLGPRYESISDAMKVLRGNSVGLGLIKSLKHPGRYSYRGFYWYYG